MSTLNVLVDPDGNQGTVLVDTRGTHGLHTSKLMAIPHLNALVAARGRSQVFSTMVSQLQTTAASFDENIDGLDSLFRGVVREANAADKSVWKMMREHNLSLYGSADEGQDEFVIVGWSDKHQQVRGASVAATIGGEETSVNRDIWYRISPPQAKVLEVFEKGVPLRDTLMLSIVRLQLSDLAEMFPEAKAQGLPGFGGRLIVGQVARGHLVVRDLGAL
jgi:hypothetical protein